MAGIDVTIVPYNGTGPLTTDLLGGHVQLGFNVMAPAMGNLKAGTLRAMAVLAPKRSSHLPDVPTSVEAGLPGFEAMLNYGLLAPAGTPKPIIDRLNAALRAVVDFAGGARSGSPPTAAIRCRRRRRNTPPTSSARRRSGRR